ncbi:ABC transporter permease [Micromonospora sp. NPDC003197]
MTRANDPTYRQPGVVRWTRELLLGARMAAAGGRDGLLRTGMAAVGVGLGVALLLLAASLSTMMDGRSDRAAARNDLHFSAEQPSASAATLLIAEAGTHYRGRSIRGRILQPEGPQAPIPPGITRLPGPDELLVSPELAELLTSPEGTLLRPRLPQPVVGIIDDAGLSEPNEYTFYLGSDQLSHGGAVIRIDRFGEFDAGPDEGLDPVLLLLVVIAFVVLLLPVAVFIATAIRFGGAQRDRRLAALRLVGADSGMARRMAAGEALFLSALGLAAGVAFFLVGRQFIELITLQGLSVFTEYVRPDPVLATLILLAVPAASVGVTLLALRRIVIEPLGVVRKSGGVTRRLWWRLLLPVVGAGLLIPLLRGVGQTGGTFNQTQVVVGVLLLLVGVTALLPWLVEKVVHRLPRSGDLSWQLAVRRLQLDSGTSARMVNGIAVAVAGGIALQMLFAGIADNYTRYTGQDVTRAQAMVHLDGADQDTARTTTQRFTALSGVTPVASLAHTTLRTAGSTPEPDQDQPTSILFIGDCLSLAELVTWDRCTDGDVFVVPPEQPEVTGEPIPPAPGQPIEILSSRDSTYRSWTVPADARTAIPRPDPVGRLHSGILATPGAVEAARLSKLDLTVYLRLDPAAPDAIELVRNAAAGISPLARVSIFQESEATNRFASIQRGLYVGVVATLSLLALSLLVGTLEHLRERRRLLAVLVAFGTKRSTLSWSVLWQAAIPVLLGLLLAVVIGTALGAVLLEMTSERVRLDWPSILGMSGLALSVVLLVTGLSLPALWRLLKPDGLRTE